MGEKEARNSDGQLALAARYRHAIRQWSLGVAAAQIAAPRFQLRPGQAVLIDNFRLLHGRDPYSDLVLNFA